MSSDGHNLETRKNDSNAGRWHFELHPDVERHSPHSALRFGSFIHPTHATLASPEHRLNWTSRDHRKHRHMAADPRTGKPRYRAGTLQKNREHAQDRAFTVGSIVWVINGFIAFLPFVNTHVAKDDIGGGWTAWLGATIFEFGALFGLWEAWNREDTSDFGWNIKLLLHGESPRDAENADTTPESEKPPAAPKKKKWIWFSTEGKYFHEMGFLAAFVQYLAATIFWISGFTAIPAVQEAIMTNTPLLDGVFWSPQVIGGCGFIIASSIMMIETQNKWYIPAPNSLGWHVGFWNLVGGVGFALCGALGYGLNNSTKIAYQSSCSTFWGGWAFLIGSVIQWYESVNPVQ
ncbi:hypothetical protein C8F04DRAFT_1105091 [Mycena alexandri]|uniref:Integral membrane protein n=1 Tax=Mycena alexandri TaxID=1745969 RepID=A0AAD6X344_9AGAR|nr:hypothetical protein C8F04DRAFT_1105091 [Mycena alexandri]